MEKKKEEEKKEEQIKAVPTVFKKYVNFEGRVFLFIIFFKIPVS